MTAFGTRKRTAQEIHALKPRIVDAWNAGVLSKIEIAREFHCAPKFVDRVVTEAFAAGWSKRNPAGKDRNSR